MAGINQGLGSDRLLVDWHLASARVAALAAGLPPPALAADPLPLPLPEDIATDLAAAAALRMNLRRAITSALGNGRRIAGFDPRARVYLLSDRD